MGELIEEFFYFTVMVCPANISQINGAKSKDPKSSKGKQNASLNAYKHGMLAKKPPAIGEDLALFQEFMQGLIDEFQPESPTEIMFLEQIGMARIRLYRLWATESALAAHALTPAPPLEPSTKAKYPYYEPDNDELEIKTLFHPDNRALERKLSLTLLDAVKSYGELYKDVRKSDFQSIWQEWLDTLEEVVEKFLQEHPYKSVSVNPLRYINAVEYANAYQKFVEEQKEKQSLYAEISELPISIQIAQQDCANGQYPKTKKQLRWSIIQFHFETVEEKCKERLKELDKIEKEINEAEAEQAQTVADYQDLTRRSQAIPPQIELLSRYERHIVRTMNEALDRLEAIRQRRQQQTNCMTLCSTFDLAK